MKTPRSLLVLVLSAAVWLTFGAVNPVRADITVRLSVKFILNTNGAYPSGGIGTNTGFQMEVDRGNSVLAATTRGYRLQVIEYLTIQPPPPAGQSPEFWFTNSARSSRALVEAASIDDPVGWKRNLAGAINIYVNNSSSGECAFPGHGDSITLGKSIGTGTVLHEIGHFFDLSHTHSGDPSCTDFVPPVPLSSGLTDGDRLSETIPDHPCYTIDQVSFGNFGTNYGALSSGQQAAVNRTYYNVMSYHNEDQFLDIQMDYWTANANRVRQAVCTGHTWFVALDGADFYNPFVRWDGLEPGTPFQTPDFALNFQFPDVIRTADDIILLRAGRYPSPEFIRTPSTLRATRGVVTLAR